MATAKKDVEVKEVITGVTLTLTEDEARTLTAILGRVGGYDGKGNHRERSDAIWTSLRQLGFRDTGDFIDRGMTIKNVAGF